VHFAVALEIVLHFATPIISASTISGAALKDNFPIRQGQRAGMTQPAFSGLFRA
jgi:hypothetical protein